MNPRRRTLLLSSLSLAILQWPITARAGNETQRLTLDDFRALSARLSGRPLASLDQGLATGILDFLRQEGKAGELQRLHDEHAADPQLVSEVLTAWYSGQVPTPPRATLVGFPQALIWGAAPFLHAPGTCGGATGAAVQGASSVMITRAIRPALPRAL